MKAHFSDRSVHVSNGHRKPAKRTIEIIQVSAATNHSLKAKEIASLVKAPYNSVHKTLRRLVKKGIYREDRNHFFSLIHDDAVKLLECYLSLFPTYSRDVSMLSLHGVGLKANILDLGRHVVAAGRCTPYEWNRGIGCRPKAPFEGGDLRLFNHSAYYQESCDPFPMRNLLLRYERFIRMIDYYTKGLADVQGVYLNDYEYGIDIPFDMFFWNLLDISRIEIYPKKGKLRFHVQFSKRKHRIPLDEDTEQGLETDFITALDDVNYAIHKIIQILQRRQVNA